MAQIDPRFRELQRRIDAATAKISGQNKAPLLSPATSVTAKMKGPIKPLQGLPPGAKK